MKQDLKQNSSEGNILHKGLPKILAQVLFSFFNVAKGVRKI